MAEQPDGRCWCPVKANGIKRRCLGFARPGLLHCFRDAHQYQNIDSPDSDPDPLFWYQIAAEDADLKEMDTLLTMYPDISCEETDRLAIKASHVDLVKKLVQEKKHSMSIPDMCFYAAKSGKADIVQFMVEQEQPTMELVSRMVIKAVWKNRLNVVQFLWSIPEFKSVISETYDRLVVINDRGLSLLTISSFNYDFDMTQWIVKNITFDIETKNDILRTLISSKYGEDYDGSLGAFVEITPHQFFKMVTLLVTVGKADVAQVWHFLRKRWSKDVSKLIAGEDDMLKNLIKTLYLFEQPTESVDDELRDSRYAYLVDEVEDILRQKVSERKNSLPDLFKPHLLPDLGKMILDFDHVTTGEIRKIHNLDSADAL
jgi:hypothetical protein